MERALHEGHALSFAILAAVGRVPAEYAKGRFCIPASGLLAGPFTSSAKVSTREGTEAADGTEGVNLRTPTATPRRPPPIGALGLP
jgi:hypothetical protein